MNQQHLDNEGQDSLRSQRMTEDEARAVIHLWQQEETDNSGLTSRPAVPDVAEGLNVSLEDVQRLLAQVRAQREEEEQQFTQDWWLLELEQIRLAEEERRLAEIQRQRAELQREHSERLRRRTARRTQAEEASDLVVYPQSEFPSALSAQSERRNVMAVIAVIIFVLMVVSLRAGIFTNSPSSLAGNPPGTSCMVDNRSVPCSELPDSITQQK